MKSVGGSVTDAEIRVEMDALGGVVVSSQTKAPSWAFSGAMFTAVERIENAGGVVASGPIARVASCRGRPSCPHRLGGVSSIEGRPHRATL